MTKIMQNGHKYIHTSLIQSNPRTAETQTLSCQKYPQFISDFISMHNILTSSILKLAVSRSSFRQTYIHIYIHT